MYLQYAHARCRSILRKATVSPSPDTAPQPPAPASGYPGELLVHPAEQGVLKQLARMPHAVREAGDKYLPATVAEWVYSLAREFATFYDECPVLRDDVPAELKSARLALVSAVAQGLKNGLALLGIHAPERV